MPRHTLHGSLAMANVGQAAGLTDALDQFVEQVFRHGDALDAAQREYVAAAVDAVEVMVGQLQSEAPDCCRAGYRRSGRPAAGARC